MAKRLLTFIFVISCLSSFAQEVEVRGGFIQSSYKVGEPVQYWLTARYSKELQVVFAGEAYDYTPFELVERKYFPSETDSAYILDSAVYDVMSFEMDSVQGFRLPVFIVGRGDSTAIYSPTAVIQFQPLIEQMPDTLALVLPDGIYEIEKEFNYPNLLIALGIFFILILAALLIWGKQLRARYQAYRLQKVYKKFSIEFDVLTNAVRTEPEPHRVEQAYVRWKYFLQALESKPISTYTSAEVNALYRDEQLAQHLHAVDRVIYGRVANVEVRHSLGGLKHFAHARFTERLSELKRTAKYE